MRSSSKKFTVQVMKDNMLDFKSLLVGRQSPLVKRKKNKDGDLFVWKNICWIQHRRTLPLGTLAYKDTLDKDAAFSLYDFKRFKKERITLNPEQSQESQENSSEEKERFNIPSIPD